MISEYFKHYYLHIEIDNIILNVSKEFEHFLVKIASIFSSICCQLLIKF